MRKIRVQPGSNSYDICVGAGILEQIGQLLREIGCQGKVVIITDTTVKGLYGVTLQDSLSAEGFSVSLLEIPPGEAQKSLETARQLYDDLSALYAERSTPVLALGGGVVGDLAGFVAATYLRGMPLVQIPTTLLAQVDSSIGGKVAVDHGRLKNMIGVFYQPRLVIADVGVLKTLDARELGNGLAEVIKYAVISDGGFFAYLENNLDRIKALDPAVLEEVVAKSAEVKARVVEKDERDTGLRNILNYGHTTGHAIEAVSDFAIAHGEAVAIGMVVAGEISHRLGMLSIGELERIARLISRAGLPARLPTLDVDKLIEAMKHDKKVSRGKVKLVLARAIGDVFVTDEVGLSLVEEVLRNEAT
ncbi:MAG: 3-dehydroquinate synthase [Chloroflexi bacterium]|nr:3-dehydroquinate synthase [Chloroflexota bacterium]